MGLLGFSLEDPVSLTRLGLILRTRLAWHGGGFRAAGFDVLPCWDDGLAGLSFPLLWRWLEKGETVSLLFEGGVLDELEMFLGERLCWGGVFVGMVQKCTSWGSGMSNIIFTPTPEREEKQVNRFGWVKVKWVTRSFGVWIENFFGNYARSVETL